MTGVILAAHSELADAFLNTARSVTQFQGKAAAVGVRDSDTSAVYEERLRKCVAEVRDGGGVLILTDMFGGTPSNVGMTLHESGVVEVITGTSLPMLIKALQLSEEDHSLEDVARRVREAGRGAIVVASDVLGVRGPKL